MCPNDLLHKASLRLTTLVTPTTSLSSPAPSTRRRRQRAYDLLLAEKREEIKKSTPADHAIAKGERGRASRQRRCQATRLTSERDGTTTATVLARAIFLEGCKALAAGMHSHGHQTRHGQGVKIVLETLAAQATMITWCDKDSLKPGRLQWGRNKGRWSENTKKLCGRSTLEAFSSWKDLGLVTTPRGRHFSQHEAALWRRAPFSNARGADYSQCLRMLARRAFFFLRRSTHSCVARTLRPPCTAFFLRERRGLLFVYVLLL